MFIQVIKAGAKDAAAIRKQLDKWHEQVKPGATGWVGHTGGVTSDGQMIALVRFESEDAARANSSRPEQSEWWKEMEKLLDSPTFEDSSDIDTFLQGGSDTAGFVQIMQGRCTDRAKLLKLEETMMDQLQQARPDLIGMTRAWHGGDRFTAAAYFSSEADARKGEAAEESDGPADAQEWQGLLEDMAFLDLTDPWLAG